VKLHPTVYFSSKHIVRDGDAYKVLGDLTANGVTRPTEFRMMASKIVPWEGTAFRAFTLTTAIDRRDFGMTFKDPDGLKNDPLFGKKLGIKFTIEVTDKPNASKFNAPQNREPF
jgi:polyisoprenoid-binding protein YceI